MQRKNTHTLFITIALLLGLALPVVAQSSISIIERISFNQRSDGQGFVVRFHTAQKIPYFELEQGPGKIKLTLHNADVPEYAQRDIARGPVTYYTIQRLRNAVVLRFDLNATVPVKGAIYQDSNRADLLMGLTYVASPVTQRIENSPPTVISPAYPNTATNTATKNTTTAGSGVVVVSPVVYGNGGTVYNDPYATRNTTTTSGNYDNNLQQWEVDSPEEVNYLITEAEALATRLRTAQGNERIRLERALENKLQQIFEYEQAIYNQQILQLQQEVHVKKERLDIRGKDQANINAFRKEVLLEVEPNPTYKAAGRHLLFWGRSRSSSIRKSLEEPATVIVSPTNSTKSTNTTKTNTSTSTADRRSDW